jgi:uncharacterized protein YegJ (DUF2314 family)
MLIRLFFVSVVCLCPLGCGGDGESTDQKSRREEGDVVRREGRPDIIRVADDNPAMSRAIERARSSAEEFIRALQDPPIGADAFSVKLLITDPGNDEGEPIWLFPVRYENGSFFGNVNNEPDAVKSVRVGQEVEVAPDRISDWMYIQDGKLIGGFTIRVLRDGMSPSERAEFDRNMPFAIQ